MPVTEHRPQRASPASRLWRITRDDARFLDIDRLTAAQRRDIMSWGERSGLARYAQAWEVKAYDRERGAWRTVRCTDPAKAAIVLTEPFLTRREVVQLRWFVANPTLEEWHREKVLPDATAGVLALKYAADVLDCDGAFRRHEDGTRRIALFAHRLTRWHVTQIALHDEPTYRPVPGSRLGTHLDVRC